MSGPPENLSPTELYAKLQEMPRPSVVVDFPRKGPDGMFVGQISMRVLTVDEKMRCETAAEKFAKQYLKEGKHDDLGYASLYSDALVIETLWRACCDANDIKRSAFPTPKALREELTTEECAALWEHYLTCQVQLGPLLLHMSEKDMDAWIDRLAEGGQSGPFTFNLLNSVDQKKLLTIMASRLRSYWTATDSAGSQQDDST